MPPAPASTPTNDVDMFVLGYPYSLSKRPAFHTQAAHIKNKGSARFAAPGGPPGLIAVGSSSSGFEAGIRHSF